MWCDGVTREEALAVLSVRLEEPRRSSVGTTTVRGRLVITWHCLWNDTFGGRTGDGQVKCDAYQIRSDVLAAIEKSLAESDAALARWNAMAAEPKGERVPGPTPVVGSAPVSDTVQVLRELAPAKDDVLLAFPMDAAGTLHQVIEGTLTERKGTGLMFVAKTVTPEVEALVQSKMPVPVRLLGSTVQFEVTGAECDYAMMNGRLNGASFRLREVEAVESPPESAVVDILHGGPPMTLQIDPASVAPAATLVFVDLTAIYSDGQGQPPVPACGIYDAPSASFLELPDKCGHVCLDLNDVREAAGVAGLAVAPAGFFDADDQRIAEREEGCARKEDADRLTARQVAMLARAFRGEAPVEDGQMPSVRGVVDETELGALLRDGLLTIGGATWKTTRRGRRVLGEVIIAVHQAALEVWPGTTAFRDDAVRRDSSSSQPADMLPPGTQTERVEALVRQGLAVHLRDSTFLTRAGREMATEVLAAMPVLPESWDTDASGRERTPLETLRCLRDAADADRVKPTYAALSEALVVGWSEMTDPQRESIRDILGIGDSRLRTRDKAAIVVAARALVERWDHETPEDADLPARLTAIAEGLKSKATWTLPAGTAAAVDEAARAFMGHVTTLPSAEVPTARELRTWFLHRQPQRVERQMLQGRADPGSGVSSTSFTGGEASSIGVERQMVIQDGPIQPWQWSSTYLTKTTGKEWRYVERGLDGALSPVLLRSAIAAVEADTTLVTEDRDVRLAYLRGTLWGIEPPPGQTPAWVTDGLVSSTDIDAIYVGLPTLPPDAYERALFALVKQVVAQGSLAGGRVPLAILLASAPEGSALAARRADLADAIGARLRKDIGREKPDFEDLELQTEPYIRAGLFPAGRNGVPIRVRAKATTLEGVHYTGALLLRAVLGQWIGWDTFTDFDVTHQGNERGVLRYLQKLDAVSFQDILPTARALLLAAERVAAYHVTKAAGLPAKLDLSGIVDPPMAEPPAMADTVPPPEC
jgi:hypothetical protein